MFHRFKLVSSSDENLVLSKVKLEGNKLEIYRSSALFGPIDGKIVSKSMCVPPVLRQDSGTRHQTQMCDPDQFTIAVSTDSLMLPMEPFPTLQGTSP